MGSVGRADYAEPAENLVRVLALHHHPLPQATGEGKRFLGVPDEPLMYLAAPATFLEAATSLNVNLVLHGHRHVEGAHPLFDPGSACHAQRERRSLLAYDLRALLSVLDRAGR